MAESNVSFVLTESENTFTGNNTSITEESMGNNSNDDNISGIPQ